MDKVMFKGFIMHSQWCQSLLLKVKDVDSDLKK